MTLEYGRYHFTKFNYECTQDYVSIDTQFIRGLNSNKESMSILYNIVVAKDIGLPISIGTKISEKNIELQIRESVVGYSLKKTMMAVLSVYEAQEKDSERKNVQ